MISCLRTWTITVGLLRNPPGRFKLAVNAEGLGTKGQTWDRGMYRASSAGHGKLQENKKNRAERTKRKAATIGFVIREVIEVQNE